jgi:hypothetical protein
MTTHLATVRFLTAAAVLVSLSGMQSGCMSLGPRTFKADQVDYSRALGDAKKRQILALIVGLRYADAPAFLNVSQVIAGYTFTASATAVANSTPDPGGPGAGLTGMASYSDHPTFTFTPTTGESYAKAYIHPLLPAQILPLADGGVPIDLLLRIAVQSIGGLSNAAMLGGPSGNGSPGFFELLAVLRRLQLAGEVSIAYKPGPDGGSVSLALGLPRGSASAGVAQDVARVRELLALPGGTAPYPITTGNDRSVPRGIAIVTRSVLGILTDLGAEIEVPAADINDGATKPAVQLVGGETRPVILIHTAKKMANPVYASIVYRNSRFWIDDADFDSKYALTVVQDLMALAEETDVSHAPVVTVPAN